MGAISIPAAIGGIDAPWHPHDQATADGPAHALMLERPETGQHGNH